MIVALNSTSPTRALTNGRIRRRQLDLCAEAFASAPEGAARIVVTHHHWAPVPDYGKSEVMPGAKQALDTLTGLGVDLILTGHLHRASIVNSLDVYAGQDRNHGILIVQCGTSTSRRGRAREREKNSFNWIQITDRNIRITHYMYFAEAGGFAPMSRHLFPRARQPYFQKPLTSMASSKLRPARYRYSPCCIASPPSPPFRGRLFVPSPSGRGLG